MLRLLLIDSLNRVFKYIISGINVYSRYFLPRILFSNILRILYIKLKLSSILHYPNPYPSVYPQSVQFGRLESARSSPIRITHHYRAIVIAAPREKRIRPYDRESISVDADVSARDSRKLACKSDHRIRWIKPDVAFAENCPVYRITHYRAHF